MTRHEPPESGPQTTGEVNTTLADGHDLHPRLRAS
jgi:hypothetical protein